MSQRAADPKRLQRLARLLALAQAEARRSEQALGAALARLESAQDRRRRIDGLIADVAPRPGQAGALPLAAGAQLRALLAPAADAAAAGQASATAERQRAEARLAAMRSRVDRLESMAQGTRARQALEDERRQQGLLPGSRARRA